MYITWLGRYLHELAAKWQSALQQVWRRLPGQQDEAESLKAQSGEEDGAVEALVHSGSEGGGQPTEAVAERRRGWLQRLAQLQNVAVSAASTVGGMSNIMPTYIHFGQTVTWPAVSLLTIRSFVFPCCSPYTGYLDMLISG